MLLRESGWLGYKKAKWLIRLLEASIRATLATTTARLTRPAVATATVSHFILVGYLKLQIYWLAQRGYCAKFWQLIVTGSVV